MNKITKYILPSFKGYKLSYLKNDIPAGIIVAALTIPVAMGYAQVAGLPPIYGLYASMIPVLGYVVFASSRQMVFGMDAGGSAITGSAIAAMGITYGSAQAIWAAPILALFAGAFLIIFSVLKLGRFSEYISKPVISGFISGISLSIMISQLPKMFGVTAADSNFFENIAVLFTKAKDISLLSVGLAAITIAIVLLGKKFLPKIPFALILLIIATALSAYFHFNDLGVNTVGHIPKGIPPFSIPDIFKISDISLFIGYGFATAVIIFAASIVAAESFADKAGYSIDTQKETFAYGASSLLAAFTGCPPTSGSVSRTAASEQFHGRSQMVSVVSAIVITLIVLFLGEVLYYMPQPVLAGIVFAAMVGILEIGQVRFLLKASRAEAIIWIISAASVVVVGVLFGVMVGIALSFIDVIMRLAKPPRAFLGKIKGSDGYYDFSVNTKAKEIPGVLIYRFSAMLVFANIKLFVDDINNMVTKEKPSFIIIDATAIPQIDDTASQELRKLLTDLKSKNIDYCFAGAVGRLRNMIKDFQLDDLIDDKHEFKTIDDALSSRGKSVKKG